MIDQGASPAAIEVAATWSAESIVARKVRSGAARDAAPNAAGKCDCGDDVHGALGIDASGLCKCRKVCECVTHVSV